MGREALPRIVPMAVEPGSPVRGEYPQAYQEGQKIHPWRSDQERRDAKHIQAFVKMHRQRGLKHDADLSCVCRGIFIGSMGAAFNLLGLRAAGVTHILNVSPIVPCFYREEFTYKELAIGDDHQEDLTCHFEATNAFIQEGILEGGVLVHCYAGVSRSAALILAYLISVMQMDFLEALKLVQKVRSRADPNSGFRKQLEALSELNQQEDKAEVPTLDVDEKSSHEDHR